MDPSLAHVLNYCSANHVIYRALKPGNLLGLESQLKIADFGWSLHTTRGRRETASGRLDYLPPEIIEGRGHDHQIGVWALGNHLDECLLGNSPFETQSTEETYRRVARVDLHSPKYFLILPSSGPGEEAWCIRDRRTASLCAMF